MVVCDRDFWQFIKIILCVYILIDGSEIFNNIAPGTSFVSRHHAMVHKIEDYYSFMWDSGINDMDRAVLKDLPIPSRRSWRCR